MHYGPQSIPKICNLQENLKCTMGYQGDKIIYKTGLIFSPYVAHFSSKKHWGVIVFIVCDLG